MRIGLFQSDIDWCNKEYNLAVAEKKIREAKEHNCRIIFFPEMSFTGFSMDTERTKESDNFTINLMSDIAKRENIAVGFGYVKDCGNYCENRYAVVDRDGKLISDYAKIHPFSYGYEGEKFKGGNKLTQYVIDGMIFSTFICYDLRFPEIFQGLKNVPDVIVVPANWPKSRSHHWKTLLQARAIESQCYVLGVNCVGVHDETYYSGDTMAVDPNGEILSVRSNIQDLLIVDINNDAYLYREKFDVRSDRKPELYRTLL